MFVERVGRLAEGDAAPLYQQLQRVLRNAIERQVLAPAEALPAERDLAIAFNVSRVTVRKALEHKTPVAEVVAGWSTDREKFLAKRKKYLLYQ